MRTLLPQQDVQRVAAFARTLAALEHGLAVVVVVFKGLGAQGVREADPSGRTAADKRARLRLPCYRRAARLYPPFFALTLGLSTRSAVTSAIGYN